MKKRNPYKVSFDTVRRFRGLADPDGLFNTSKDYAGGISNVTSSRIGQIDGREGQDDYAAYDEKIHQGGRELTARHLQEGTDFWVENVGVTARPGIIDYPPPPDIVYPDIDFPEVEPPPPVDPITCGLLWDSNDSMSAYENVGEDDTLIVNADTSPCWTITCADMWALFPEYSDYEIPAVSANETELTGGTTPISDCWSETLNCNAMYALYPEWDEYRAKNAEFPDCWDFTDLENLDLTCEQYWTKYNTPAEFRNTDGTYPDCIKIPEPFVYPPNFCDYAIEDFHADPPFLTFNVQEGYSSESTEQFVQVTFLGRFNADPKPEDNFIVNTAIGLTLWEVDYSYRTRLVGTCRDQIDVIYRVTLVEGLIAPEEEA